jgi:hypothetical protein
MENKKQTAVDWFIEEIEEKGGAWENASISRIQISISVEDYVLLKNQAREMGKEQIQEAFKHGELPPLFVNFDSEEYYTETYNK